MPAGALPLHTRRCIWRSPFGGLEVLQCQRRQTQRQRILTQQLSGRSESRQSTWWGRWRLAAWREAWLSWRVGVFAASLPARYDQLLHLQPGRFSLADIRGADTEAIRAALAQLGVSVTFYAAHTVVLEIAFALVFCAVAVVVVRRGPSNWWSLLVSLGFVAFGTTALPTVWALAEGQPILGFWARHLYQVGWALSCSSSSSSPTGASLPGWTRLFVAAWLTWQVSQATFPGSSVDLLSWPPLIGLLLMLGCVCLGASGQIHRYRHVVERCRA